MLTYLCLFVTAEVIVVNKIVFVELPLFWGLWITAHRIRTT